MEKYIIIKHIKNNRGISVPVILIDSQNEIMEFESEKEATELKTLFQANSDSGHIYEVKRII
jgi:glutaredoxin